MVKKLTFLQHCIKSIHFVLCAVTFILCSESRAQIMRSPANFVPDDDVIVVPLEYESHFINRHMDMKNQRLRTIKSTLDNWARKREYVEEWGLQGTGIYNPPTQEQMFNFFHRNFFRYVGRRVNEPLKRGINEWWDGSQEETDAEISAIQQTTQSVNKKDKSGTIFKKVSKKKVIKETKYFKLKTRVRPLRGFISLSGRTPWVNIDAIVGANGRMEVKAERYFVGSRIYTMINHDVLANRTIGLITMPFTKTISGSITHTLTPTQSTNEDTRFTLGYRKSF